MKKLGRMIIAKDRSLVGHVISQRQMEHQIPEDKLDLMFEASNIALNWVYWADDATLFNATMPHGGPTMPRVGCRVDCLGGVRNSCRYR